MGIVILVICVLTGAALLIDMAIEKYQRTCYFIYRYSGMLFITFGFLLLPLCITDKAFIPVFPVMGMFFYPIWLAKVSALCIHSSSEHWVMLILKIFFWIVWIVIFPLAIFAEYLYQKFAQE